MKNFFSALFSALLCLAAPAKADIIYSGIVNIPIPNDIEGVYLNPITGSTMNGLPGDWNNAPWINPFLGGVDIWSDALFRPVILNSDQVFNLAEGTIINDALTFAAGENASQTHIGNDAFQFQLGTPGYIGFAMQPTPGGSTFFGWAKVIFNNTTPGTIVSYAYEDAPKEPIVVGMTAVPEPGSASLLLLAGAVCWRRKK